MSFARNGAVAIACLLHSVAAAEDEVFRVDVNPALGVLRYETPGMASGSLGCGEEPFACDFGLELDMRLQLNGLGKALATVDTLELHRPRGIFADYPDTLDFLESNLKSLLTSSAFLVAPGPGLDDTTFTASFPMSDPLVLQFQRARLLTMHGGPDLRPVDGPKYTFAYTVPEPDALTLAALAVLAAPGVLSKLSIRVRREQARLAGPV